MDWIININTKTAGTPRVTFTPNPETRASIGDQIFWANNDSQPHWPGLKNANGTINKTYFMPNQIASNSQSSAFVPTKLETLNYVCSIHEDEKGSIEIVPPKAKS